MDAPDSNMNELILFAVFDVKANAYLQPFFQQNNMVALRAFEAAVNESDHQFQKWPEDYSLWRIGRFDQVDGVLASEVPQCLCKAFDLIRKPHLEVASNG